MSGIAEVLCNLGYTVQGSDVSESANVNRLRDRALPSPSATRPRTSPGRCACGVDRDQARQSGIDGGPRPAHPVVRRAEMLAELMRLKAASRSRHPWQDHTTSMVAALLDAAISIPP